MKTTINGHTYDTDRAEYLCNDPSGGGDNCLYQTKDRKFFLLEMSTFLDGVKLRPWEEVEVKAPELAYGSATERTTDSIACERRERVRCFQHIVPLSNREAMIWCIKTQVPECFRGYLLESI